MNDKYPKLIFYLRKIYKNPVTLITKDTYNILHSYESMQYKLDLWDNYNNHQLQQFDLFEKQLNENRSVVQVEKFAVENKRDEDETRTEIEKNVDFVRWLS